MKQEMLVEGPVARAFFAALQGGLWKRVPEPELFNLSRPQWSELLKMATLQTVEGVVCHGLQLLPADRMPPKDLLVKWIARLQQIEERNVWMNGIVAQQVAFFEKHELFPLMQKGQGVAQYYKFPLSRVCGDIDWCFSEKSDYNKVVAELEKLNISVTHSHGYSLSYKWKGCDIEHHQDLIELRNPLKSKYLKALQQTESPFHGRLDADGAQAHIPAPILSIVLVNVHILKHLVTYGIGTKQLCDAAVLYATLLDPEQGEYLKSIYKKLGILRWIYVLHEVLVTYLGLDPEKLPFSQPKKIKGDWMMEDILRGGNFGFHDPAHPDHDNPGGRVNRLGRLWYSFRRYVPLAPQMTITSPLVILFSKYHRGN